MYSTQEMNGSSKFSTPPSLTRIVPEPAVDKSFYNPFTVDLSLNDTNPPGTGTCAFKNSNKAEASLSHVLHVI